MDGSGKVNPSPRGDSDATLPAVDSLPVETPEKLSGYTENASYNATNSLPTADDGVKATQSSIPVVEGGSMDRANHPGTDSTGGMPTSGTQGFFPIPPMMGMPMGSADGNASENAGNKMMPFGGWIMDGMMPMPMMQNMGTSIDGSLMPAMFQTSGSNVMKTDDGSQMPMMFYNPMMTDGMSTDFSKMANGKMMNPQLPNIMTQLWPTMDENTALNSLNMLFMPQKSARQKRVSELDSMKSIPTSVQVRETCQLKSWRRKLQKGRVQQKLEAEGNAPVSQLQQHDDTQDTLVDTDYASSPETTDKDLSQPVCLNIEMSWHQNRYQSDYVLTDADMKCLRLFDEDEKDTYKHRVALGKIKSLDPSCYSFMYMDDLEIPISGEDVGNLRLWEDFKEETSSTISDNELSLHLNDPITPKVDTLASKLLGTLCIDAVADRQPLHDGSSSASSSIPSDLNSDAEDNKTTSESVMVEQDNTGQLNIEDELASDFDEAFNSDSAEKIEDQFDEIDTVDTSLNAFTGDVPNLMDELEDELLGELPSDAKSSDSGDRDQDLEDEFDFGIMDQHHDEQPLTIGTFAENQTVVPAPSTTVEPSRMDDVDYFGEIPGTYAHYRAQLSRLMDAGDIVHEWRRFRNRFGPDISLSELVEFEHVWRIFQEKRVEEICQMVGIPMEQGAADVSVDEKADTLYRMGKANLNLLLQFDRPEVQSLLASSIYNLNAPNVVYSAIPNEEEIEDNEEAFLSAEADPNTPHAEEAPTPTTTDPVNFGEEDEDTLPVERESDIRRSWRRRLQTLTKETRLALVNMGKSLKDIENVSSNIEQRRAYDSVVEFCEVAEMFRQCDYANLLNQSFDDYYEKANPHDTGVDDSSSTRRELLHTRVAKNLCGVLPLVGKAAKYHNVRFHRPDFRSGLFAEHLKVLRGNYSSEWCAWPCKPLLHSNLVTSFTEESGGADDVKSHPSNYFIHSRDLSLNDDCKVALMEYVEQHPLLLANCGMASRVDNYVNHKEDETRKDVAFLGPLGTLCQANDGIELFGVKYNVPPGDGQTILESTLFKAPIFVHPRPGSTWEQSLSINTTDFLLTRSRGGGETVIRLRPLTWQNGVAVYTVGQCEPKVDIPAPGSKTFVEHTNELLKAWVLKSVMVGSILDVKHLRKEARKKFCPVLSEKDISHMLKQIESTPIFSLRAQALERLIHGAIKPELICALESARAGKARLATMGILHLKNPDNVGGIYDKMEKEERQYQQSQQAMDKRLRELKSSYAKRLEAHGVTGEKLDAEMQQFDFGLHVSMYGHLEERTIAPKVKFIKELLDLTPWNISRDVRQVLSNRGTSQFALYGYGDPSGNLGEGINLLKRQANDTSVDSSNAGEDLRKLSMDELRKRLLCYGVSKDVIKTLPRWDQVALVRKYRDSFGGQGPSDGDHLWRIPPEEYEKKLNDILLRQKAALSRDSPLPSEDEADREDAEGIADALLEEFDDASFKDDEIERRELEILRQLREAQSSGPLSEEERMAEVNKLKAVPGIMWLRQSRNVANEEFENPRAVIIYGEDNARKLLRWRARRVAAKKSNVHGDVTTNPAVSGKRICRSCGQSGHIASNPKCPLYKGDKSRSLGDITNTSKPPIYTPATTRKIQKYSDSSDNEITASTAALECDTTEFVLRQFDSRHKRRLTYQFSVDDSDEGNDRFDDGSVVASRRKNVRIGDTSAVPVANLSSNMEQLMKAVSKAVRLIEKEARFRPFASRIPESVAPNYYQIIKTPMWLSLLKSKCKTQCYSDMVNVLDDLALIELNCKKYNSETSPNAWLRKMSEVLVDELLMRIQQLTSHLVSPSVIEEWAREHRANRIVATSPPADSSTANTVNPPNVEII
ncbi:bromodomain containing protein [Babesia bovis T2Bo]|uniref:Bromodomain containing protein n=1 Tax=Babesia bovis TaxID=5865 RepID=A7AQG8_BABBO|nr:bromodomain containing protein [Babesia bovis T2Bo]EDO06787.1 bromodomain containing protein [Babesia bovis T2Bo]|eukprot:XP_001610355.1 bromodomain containing protein [Babesia bovis T2Bo]